MAVGKATPAFIVFLLFSALYCGAQEREFFITFTDKKNSKYSSDRPEEFLSYKSIERRRKQRIPLTEADLPVSSAYCDSLARRNIKIIYTSRWLNGALVSSDSSTISKLSFRGLDNIANKSRRVGGHSFLTDGATTDSEDTLYGDSYAQVSMLSGHLMHKHGFEGQGRLIAIIDGGFLKLDKLSHFDNLTKTGKIIATKDFVDREDDVYDDSEHGTLVLSVLGGYTKGELIGMAYNANYLLLRSESTNYESIFEEIYWSIAAEYADSAGADIINSSLGYNTFDDPKEDHKYEQLNGKTTIITRAAEQAANVGMLVVTSQGNDGNRPWKYLVAPADAPSVLAVGAVDVDKEVAGFSSVGPTADGRYKPDVAAMGDNLKIAFSNNTFGFGSGTSFSAPMIAGLAAGIWQSMPGLTAKQLRESIKRSGSQYHAPDYRSGFGIPNFLRTASITELIENQNTQIYLSPNMVYDRNPELFANSAFVDSLGDVKVYNVNGVLLTQFSLQIYPGINTIPFNFAGLSKGLYYVKVSTKKLEISQKVVVQ
ncbi:MAG TPA: S8 family serine peptidase [Cytophagaceae bacterium]|jgi:hypothetical protein